jgi:MFS transporter, DHA3 family, macrolide efflux protein
MKLWSNTDFIKLWLGQLVSVVGDGIYHIAVMWWVKVETGSDALVALIALCGAVPALLMGTLGGVIADRVDRRRLLVGLDLFRAALMLVPLGLLLTERLEVWHLCGVVVLLSISGSLAFPAFQASVPLIVAEEQLTTANGLSQSSTALAGFIGPALGGVLVASLGYSGSVVVNAVSFLVSGLLIGLSRIPQPVGVGQANTGNLASDWLEGFRYFRSAPLLGGMVFISALLNFAVAPIFVLIPGLAKDVLGLGVTGYGLLEAMLPAGIVVGGLLAITLQQWASGGWMLGLVVLIGLLFAGLGWSEQLALCAALLGLAGVGVAITNVFFMVVFQTRVPSALQGRVFGTLISLSQGLRPLSLAVTASAVGLLGVQWVLLVCGAVVVLTGLVGFAVPGLPSLRMGVEPTPTPQGVNPTA